MIELPPSTIPLQSWVFNAKATRFVDGDTLDMTLDMGLHALRLERLRLLNVNAPERKGVTRQAGDEALRYTMDWIGVHGRKHNADPGVGAPEWPFRVQTYKSDAFGRFLAYVWCVECGACLNDDLIADKMANVDIRP